MPRSQPANVHIMSNPNRGGRGGFQNGRGGPPSHAAQTPVTPATTAAAETPGTAVPQTNGVHAPPAAGGGGGGRGFPRGGRGFVPGFRGRGAALNGDRGRGGPRGFRGRGRGSFAVPLPS